MWNLLPSFFYFLTVFFFFSLLPFSPTPTTTRTKFAVNIYTTNWPTSRSSYQSMTNNNSVWTILFPTNSVTSEHGNYVKHHEALDIHTAELNAIELVLTVVAKCSVSAIGRYWWGPAVVRWKSSHIIWAIVLQDKKSCMKNELLLLWYDTAKDTWSDDSFTKAIKLKLSSYSLKWKPVHV